MEQKSNLEIFYDTVNKVIFNDDLMSVVNESTKNQKFYLGNYSTTNKGEIFEEPAIVTVTKDGTFDAALKYGNVCVLNFASSVHPGGGVAKGSNAQEETLCRTSTLYFNLNTKECIDKFYNAHKALGDYKNTDDIIYTPNVQILKRNDYSTLDNAKSCAVITCAAPQSKKGNLNNKEVYEIHKKRARKILDVALDNGHTTIVLGAFGCGAFGNDPKTVARAWKEVVDEYKYKFNKIEFAVYSPGEESYNYKTFKEIFG